MAGLSEAERKALAAACYADPLLFCKTFLLHWFSDETPWFHRGLLAVMTGRTKWLLKYGEVEKIARNFVYKTEDGQERPCFQLTFDGGRVVDIQLIKRQHRLFMIPRGFSKTTLCNAVTLMDVCYQDQPVIAYLSETATHSERQLMNIRRELEQNARIHEVFGDLQPGTGEGQWTTDILETKAGCTIIAKGRGGQIRGTNIGAKRPTKIVFDDVEDRESVKTDEQRIKAKEWAYRDVIPALQEQDENAQLIVLGTMLHADALLVTFQRDPLFMTVEFSLKDKDGEYLWPAVMDEAKEAIKKRSFTLAGQLSSFYLEYYNSVRAGSDAKFRSEFFRYAVYEPDEMNQTAIALDPAISDDPGAAFAAVAVVSMTKKGLIFVRDAWGKIGASPREQLDKLFEWQKMYNCRLVGIESIAFQAALVHIAREEMFRKKQYFEIQKLTHKQKKEERVEGILQARYANGYIVHTRRFPELETQLLDWPNGKKDFPDVLAMAVALLDPHAAMALGDDPEHDPSKDIYEPQEEIGYAC